MKYSVVLILYKHQANAKGQYPIYIRITVNRKQSYISTGHFIDKKYWDEKAEQVRPGHLQAAFINPDITSRKQAIIKVVVDHQVKGLQITASALKLLVARNTDLHNLFDFAKAYHKEVHHKRSAGTHRQYKKYMKIIEDYHGSKSLTFEEITHEYLVRFETALRAKNFSGNYIHNIWKNLKALFNAARKRGVITCYPFNTYENPVYEAPRKDYITLAELDSLEKIADTTANATIKQTATYFLLGAYTGLRVSDWYQFEISEHIKENRLYIRAKKNGEWVTMPVIGRLAQHLGRVKGCRLKITEQEMNRTLKQLFPGKKITTHGARHTFAITLCGEQGISAETCSELMGITIQTCINNYYRVTNRKIDKECEAAWATKAATPPPSTEQ
jgi:integrase/recombinase XerD